MGFGDPINILIWFLRRMPCSRNECMADASVVVDFCRLECRPLWTPPLLHSPHSHKNSSDSKQWWKRYVSRADDSRDLVEVTSSFLSMFCSRRPVTMGLHHLFVGTWTKPGAIFSFEFDDKNLTLKLVEKTDIPEDEPISWMTFDVSGLCLLIVHDHAQVLCQASKEEYLWRFHEEMVQSCCQRPFHCSPRGISFDGP